MANNYFGFTPGGTQYSAQPAAAYPAAQTAYVAAQPAQTAYAAAAAPRAAQTYETFQPAPSTGTYAYAARTQVNVVLKPAAYEQKTYYQPTAQPAYTVAAAAATDTAYHAAAKPAYGGSTFQTAATRPATSQKTPGTSQVTSTGTYVYPTTTATTQATTFSTTTSGSTYSGYDAALYSAATSYYQQQQVAKTGATWKYNKGVAGTKTKMKPTPKQMQLHYCDVCKISCAGPQTYREHLEGQKHKKKEAAAKEGAASNSGRGQNQLRCELCDVACTGTDAYQAHIRGAKHQKVLKLHTMLGKPIPSTEPTIVNAGSSTTTATSKTTTGTTTSATKPPTKTIPTATATAKKVVTPKITFVGGTQLKSMTSGKSEEVKVEQTKTDVPTTPDSDKEESKKLLPGEKDVQPVGHEYIEEVKNEMGKTVSFNCKLCECKFNDPNAKEMHMKGRRHRLQYKKKVDPRLQVEIKPSIRARKIQEEKLRRQAAKEEFWRNRAADQEERWREEMMRFEEEQMYWTGGNPYDQGWQSRGGPMGGPRFGGPQGPMGMPARRPDTADDRHVVAKHASIYPSDAELQAVQSIVSSCEKGLKQVSDFIAESDAPKPLPTETKEAPVKKEPEEEKEGETKEEEKTEPTPQRVMKGVMRVGVLAKGLLLHGDLNVQLVVLCSEKPTRTLLERVYDNLPKQLASISEEKYETKLSVEEAAVVVTSEKEPKTTCTITLTSPIMREENLTEGGNLSWERCARSFLKGSLQPFHLLLLLAFFEEHNLLSINVYLMLIS